MARLWARQSTVLNRFYPTTNFRSEMPSALSTKLKTLARGAMMALALPCAAGFAQDADKAMPEATGAPRNILPVDQLPDAVAPPPEDVRAPAIPACSDITAHRLESAEPFWVELRAFCYAVTGDTSTLDLTRAVIMEQGIADPAFITLLDGMVSGKPVAPGTLRFPDSLHVVMMARLKLPMTAEIGTNLGLPASLIAAGS